MVRVIGGAEGFPFGIGCHGRTLFASGDERRQDICAGKGRVRRDRLLPKDQPLQPRADAIDGGLLGAGRGAATRRFGLNAKNRKEPFE